MVAVPLVLAVKVTPAGSVPVSVRVAAGVPVVVTVKLNALATVAVTDEALVIVASLGHRQREGLGGGATGLVAVSVSG